MSDPLHETAFAAIIEGRCPYCSGELERQDDHGWCDRCHRGWAARTTTENDPDGFPPGEHLIIGMIPLRRVPGVLRATWP